MNAARAVFAKDVRRLAVPAALLTLATAGGTAWFGGSAVEANVAWSDWTGTMHWWTQLLAMGQGFFVLQLTATLVQEDPPAGRDAFWATRPIGRGELLASKAAGALTLLALAPALGQAAVGWALGFEAGEIGHAVALGTLRSAAAVGFGLMAGALTRTLPQFLLATLALGAAMAFAGGAATTMERVWLESAARRERMETVQQLLTLFPVTVAVVGYRVRRPGAGWVAAAGGLAAIVVVGWSWPWRAPAVTPAAAGAAEKPAVVAAYGRDGAAIPREDQRGTVGPVLRVTTGPSTAERVTVPVGGRGELRWPDGARATVRLEGEAGLPDRMWQAAAGSGETPAAATWSPAVRRITAEPAVFRTGPMEWNGTVTLAVYRRAAVTEVPLRVGAEAADGSNRWRVRRYEPPRAGARAQLEIEQRGPWRGGAETGRVATEGRRETIAAWLVRPRGAAVATVVTGEDAGTVTLGGVVRAVRRFALPEGMTAEALAESTLVKVRFEREDESAYGVRTTVVAQREDEA